MIPNSWQFRVLGLLLQARPAGPLGRVPGMRSGAYRWNVLVTLAYLFLVATVFEILRAALV